MALPPRNADDALLREMGLATSEMMAGLDDRREAARFKRVQVAMLTGAYTGAAVGGDDQARQRGQSFIFFGSLLNQVATHTGKSAVGICRTACVFASQKDLRMHLAFNPFFLRALERVGVKRGRLPLDPEEARQMRSEGFWVWELGAAPPYRAMGTVMEEHGVLPKGRNDWLAVRLDMSYQVAVLVHEFMHLLHKHLEIDPNLYPDKSSLGLALDMVINQHIANLPPGGIDLLSYAPWGLTPDPNQPFIVYYEQLKAFFGDQPRGEEPDVDPNEPRDKSVTEGFVGSALISRPGGRKTPIEDVRVGDLVLTLDPSSGTIISKKVWYISRNPMSILETRARYATIMVSIFTRGGRRIERVSSKIMVAGSDVLSSYAPVGGGRPQPTYSSEFTWRGIGEKTSIGPEIRVGDGVLSEGPAGIVFDEVERLTAAAAFDNEALYQLGVLEDTIVASGQLSRSMSGYFVNGIYVKGMVALAKEPTAEGGTPQPEPPTPEGEKPEPDGNTIPPPGSGGKQIYRVGDEVTLRSGQTGTITSATKPDDDGVQQLEIDVDEGEGS